MFGRTYAFVGLERVSGTAAYDITRPPTPTFAGYFSNRDADGDVEAGTAGDLGPEGVLFVRASDSPTKSPLLLVGNEVSGTTTIWSIGRWPRGSGGPRSGPSVPAARSWPGRSLPHR